jgi:3-oxoadipate enol-lactonase
MNTVGLGDIEMTLEDRGAGRVLLFVHGFPLDHTMWQAQIDGFSRDHRVLAPDIRGFGKTPLGDCEVTMRRYADDLALLLDRLNIREKIVFCGLSMGGYIAWQFWQKYAERLAAVIVCDTRAAADTPQAREGRAALAAQVLAKGPQAAADAMLPKLFGPESERDHTDAIAATRAVILRNPAAGIAAALDGMAKRPDVTDMLGGIAIPTLVVVGEHDAISPPAEMRCIADRIPGADFATIRGAGHMSPLENSLEFNAALRRFLPTIAQGISNSD